MESKFTSKKYLGIRIIVKFQNLFRCQFWYKLKTGYSTHQSHFDILSKK